MLTEQELKSQYAQEHWGKLLLGMGEEPYDTESSARRVAAFAAKKIDELEAAIRETMLALEYARFACEHAEGRRAMDRKILSRAMSTSSRILTKNRHHLTDFQQDSYWLEVDELPMTVGLPPHPKD